MTFEELVLHNFGPFLGRTSIDLTPRDNAHPIILFGGLNGAGKTTLLDALQLALYGKNAHCSNRNGRSYSDYLEACINRSVAPSDGAAIELSFRYFADGKETTYRLHRSWAISGGGLKERFDVVRDGQRDPLYSDTWDQSVEDFIPSRLAQLFFFDGEKIEAMADLDNSASLLKTAIQGLLGLDVIDNLSIDLVALRRKKRETVSTAAERDAIEHLKRELADAEDTRRCRQRASCCGAKRAGQTRAKSLKGIEREYRDRGGVLSEQRSEVGTAAQSLGGTIP